MKGLIQIDDDNLIKSILVQHGVAAALEPKPGVALPFRYTCAWAAMPFVYAVKRYVGYEDPLDNGYRALLIPIAQNAPQEIADLINIFSDGGQDLSRIDETFGQLIELNPEQS